MDATLLSTNQLRVHKTGNLDEAGLKTEKVGQQVQPSLIELQVYKLCEHVGLFCTSVQKPSSVHLLWVL